MRKLGYGAFFLYLAFVRTLQLLRLELGDGNELAIEVVMLGHKVAVLRREAARPAFRSSDRALLAALTRLLEDYPCAESSALSSACVSGGDTRTRQDTPDDLRGIASGGRRRSKIFLRAIATALVKGGFWTAPSPTYFRFTLLPWLTVD
jgi:hypothetical protein